MIISNFTKHYINVEKFVPQIYFRGPIKNNIDISRKSLVALIRRGIKPSEEEMDNNKTENKKTQYFIIVQFALQKRDLINNIPYISVN